MPADFTLQLPVPRDLVVPRPVDPRGRQGPTRGQARGPQWRRCAPGLYVPAATATTVEQRVLEQSARLATGAVTGWAALRWWGAAFFDGLAPDGRTPLPVPLLAGTDRLRPGAGVVVQRARVAPADVVLRGGVRVVGAQRALLDEARRHVPTPGTGLEAWEEALDEAAVSLSMAFGARVGSAAGLRDWLGSRRGVRHKGFVLAALARSVDDARSPMEVRLLRRWLRESELAVPLRNPVVRDLDGAFVGMPDLLDVELGLVGEFDGEVHRSRARHTADARRHAAFRGVGLEYVEFVGTDLRTPGLVGRRLREAAGRCRPELHRFVVLQ